MKQPNILFIVTDQQRKDTLSAYGDLLSKTPNLDELAEQNMVFDNAYTTCPICTPARASMQTGLYPIHHGMLNNSYNYGNMVQELPDSPNLLSRQLNNVGYEAGYTGKWHLGSGTESVKQDEYIQTFMKDIQFAELELKNDATPTSLGYTGDDFPGHGIGGYPYQAFKDYLVENDLACTIENKISGHYHGHEAGEITSGIETTIDHYLVERGKKIINELEQKEKPWFLQLNFWGPHEPYYAPTEFLEHYKTLDIPPWENFVGDSENKPKIHDVKRGNIKEWADVLPFIQHYFASIEHIDYQIGRLFSYLKEKNLYDDLLIIFCADHGESLGIHGGLCDKALFMYEEICSIPLFIKSPKEKNKGRISQFVNTCDIYSTILDYAGIDKDKNERDGHSMKPLIKNKKIEWPEVVVTECSGIGSVLFTQRMIRKQNWKYIFNAGDIDELYDLNTDPFEKENKVDIAVYADILSDMRNELFLWMQKYKDNLIFEYQSVRLKN